MILIVFDKYCHVKWMINCEMNNFVLRSDVDYMATLKQTH